METRPRTISITGFKTSLDDAVITATVNGNPAFSGSVSNTEIAPMFSTDIDITALTIEEYYPPAPANSIDPNTSVDAYDAISVSITCISGSIKVASVESTPLQVDFFTTVSPTPQALGNNTNPDFSVTDPKYDVTLDGVAQSVSRLDGLNGAWYYEVPSGSTLSFKAMVRRRVI